MKKKENMCDNIKNLIVLNWKAEKLWIMQKGEIYMGKIILSSAVAFHKTLQRSVYCHRIIMLPKE